MRDYLPRPLRAVFLLLPGLAIGAWAQTDTLTLDNAGANYVMGGVYTSPYGISINGSAPVQLICDDFTTDISVGQSWTATVTTFAAIESGTNPPDTPKFTPADIQKYATVAVLAAELESLTNLASVQAGEISYALWDVFDPTLLNSTTNPYGTITSGELSAAQNYLTGAEALVAGATTAGIVNLSQISIDGNAIEGMTIYTPNPKSASQEFVTVNVAEPPSLAVFGLDLLGLGGLMLFARRRRSLRCI
jgi:hypothetical protein